MPSIEELLNEAELHMAAQPVNDVLEIDPETREISIPESEIILGVETDQRAERKYFHCPKIVGNNIDLSKLELFVVFQNASNKEEGKDRYHVTDVKTTSDGYITFSWELSAKVTAYKGDVQFVVCAIKTDSSGVKQNVWNTTIAIGKCLIGLSSDMSASEEQSASDLYTQLISELNSTASAKLAEVTTQIQTVGNNQVSNVNNAGTTQVNNVQNKGTEVLASIPDTYTELDASVKQLNEQIRGKAPVITESTTIQSGSPTTVTDSAEMPLQGLNVYGKSKQVTTTGKNLCSIKSCQLSTNIVSSDIVPWTKLSQVYYAFDTQNISGAQAYISVKYHNADKKIVGSNGATIDCDGTRKTGFFNGKYADNGSDIDLTTIEYISVQLGLYSDSVTPSLIDNIMISGDKNTSFEPYTGGKPSPSPEYPQEIVSVGEKGSIGVEITGKNLLNPYLKKSTTVNGITCAPNGDGTYTLNGTATKKVDFIVFTVSKISSSSLFGKTLKLVGCPPGGNRDSKYAFYFQRQLAPNYTPIIADEGNGSSSLEINDSIDGAWSAWIRIHSGYTCNNLVFKPMITTDLSATYDDFEPYKTPRTTTIPLSNGLPGIPVTTGGNYTDENGQQYICDVIDFARGKYIQRVWKGVFDGSEDEKWRKISTNYVYIECLPVVMNSREGFCSQYIVGDDTRGIRIGNGNAMLIVFGDFSDENALSNFKDNLSANPFKVMTYLDTPIETDLTEAQIQAYKSLTTFKPTSIISNDANAWMIVDYACDTKTWVTNKINTLIKEATTS